MNRETPAPAPEPGAPREGRANAAELKAEHWRRADRANEQEAVFDPGLSMLGTDDEAGGYPLSGEDLARARADERHEPRSFAPRGGVRRDPGPPATGDTSPPTVSYSAQPIEDAAERRFSPEVLVAVALGLAMVGGVFWLLA